MSSLNLADIGLTPSVRISASDKPAVSSLPEHNLVPGSVFSQALFHMWKGTEVVIVKSPPGGGKSTMVANLADILRRNVPEPVTIITPTNAAANAIGTRILDAFGPGTAHAVSSGVTALPEVRASTEDASIAISTIASAIHRKPHGIVIVDEAYQASFADVCQAVDSAHQVLMVGDPGQIGPVTTIDTSIFDHLDFGPHTPAPAVFEKNPDAVVLRLESTFRLGKETTGVVSGLYDFEFDSLRLPHSIDGLPEIEAVEAANAVSHSSPDLLGEVVERVQKMIGLTHRYVDHETRTAKVHEIEPHHVAVLAAHNVQTSYIEASLRAQDGALGAVTVGTADRLQGGQWPVVVVLDPLAGVQGVTSHHTSLGRLCVMLSRHTSHLSFIHERSWKTRLAEAQDLSRAEVRTHRQVRTQMGA